MTPDEFRARGAAVVERIARYMEEVGDLPVASRVAPGEIRRRLPAHPPTDPEPFADVLADVDRVVLDGLTHWQSPGFFGYFPANASGPSILGELLSAGFGVQGMLWSTSPACTELEQHVLDWMLELCDLPPRFRSDGAGGGVIQDSASSATLVSMLAARHRAGAPFDRLVAYTSTEGHSSIDKGARIAGIGHLRKVGTDDTLALDPAALDAAMAADRDAGLVPFHVTATVGTTSTTAIDPVAAVARVARRHGAWLHVDGALAGAAAVAPELRFVNDGLDGADSYCFNPHKWLFTNFDCNCFWVADRGPLLEALSILPEYLRNAATESGEVVDYRDWQIPLGRRFRALKLWFVIRHYGATGLAHHVREHVGWAAELAERLAAHPKLVLAAPHPLNLVCFRHVDGDDATRALMAALNATGRVFLTHTTVHGRFVVRVSIGATATRHHHVVSLADAIDELA
ncbi:MAG: pyridoxal-dependent decarboxylase [Actinomycetota bacterium]|nr:pyridoxal-dependent decarboxylase [Actinomycetota bacterium]